MTLINLDSTQFYQTPSKADLGGERPSMTLVGDVPVLYREQCALTVPKPSGGGERNENFPSFELLLGVVGAQESQ